MSGKLLQQMPLWEERVRCLPSPMARSALFCVGSRAPRVQLKNALIASLSDTTIRYTGTELRQDDEDVFLQLCHLARGRSVDDMIEFSAYSMLKFLGWGFSAKSYTRLRECIERLKANALKVSVKLDEKKQVEFSGSLIRKFIWSDDGKKRQQWRVWLEREVVVLFGQRGELEWDIRNRLKGGISKWLHSFLVDRNETTPLLVSELRDLCGSKCESMSAYRQMLRDALKQLKENGNIFDWRMDANYVWISRSPDQIINRVKPSNFLAISEENVT